MSNTPRLLLFGMPGAGKSALLDALVQHAPALSAKLVTQSDSLQQYQLQPEKVSGPFSGDITVIDASGQAALELLQAPEPFAHAHPMHRPIRDADAVVFVVDVSAAKEQMVKEFRQCARWLRSLHEYRGKRTDIADLPVYVVLNKSDLLARKDDTLVSWQKRLDEAKHQYETNFRKFLKQHEPGFGTIQLKVVTSAITHPPLADKPAKTSEPFGVAELFRDALRAANDFQERRQVSQSRLQNVLVGLAGMVALLALGVAFFFEFQPPAKANTLDEKVQLVMPKPTATAVERLAGAAKKLEDRHKRLREIEEDADFKRMPAETQKAVTAYRTELADYMKLYQEAQDKLKLPHLAKNDAELREFETSVKGIALPETHAKDWADTRLGRRLTHLRGEYEKLNAELSKEAEWLTGQTDANKALLKEGSQLYLKLLNQEPDAVAEAKKWQRRFVAANDAEPPTARSDNVPGVSRIVYEDLAKFEPVKSAQKAWRTSQDDLRNLSSLIQKKVRGGA